MERISDDVVYVQLSRDNIEKHYGKKISDKLWEKIANDLIYGDSFPLSFNALEKDIAQDIDILYT